MPLISDIKVDKNKLFSNFKDIRNVGNFKMLSCIRLLFNKSNIFKNVANYMLIILFSLSISSIIAFIFYDKNKILELIEGKKDKIHNNNNKVIIQINQNPIINIINNNIKIKKKKKHKKKFIKRKQKNSNSITKLNKSKVTSNIKKLKIKKYNDYELNNLEYQEALKNDKRNFSQLYISLVKTNHLLIFSFFQFNDYNSKTIKIYLFFFTFATNLIVSAMFYSDSTMHKIYIDDGLFDFTYQLPQMFYSFIISTVLESLLNLLGLYEQDIAEFKQFRKSQKDKEKLLSKINIKIILFFIINYILLFSFWLYLGCFCAVYKNTQIHLLIDVSSSFSISFITPFIVIILPCIFRVQSLKDKKGKRQMLFKFSNFLLNF